MEKNWKKKLKNSQGITLVALVVTIIVLLILAGVSLSAVFSQDGIFRRAEQATDKHGQAKARETLELALGEAQMQKYEEGLTDEQLTNKINEIGEEIEERENPDISQAIVDGYIFSVDRTVPKILDYLGPADGVIITAKVSGNGGWFKQGDTVNVTVTGKIKTYSGGTITTVSATKGGTAITGFSIDAEGRYTIDNITADTTIVINAEDSKDKKGSKTVPITIRIDTIPPTLTEVTATAEANRIKIKAVAIDNESGLKQINYNVSPTTVNSPTGTLSSGQEITLIATKNNEYTITFTAEDNAGNLSAPQTATAETMGVIKHIKTPTGLKEVNTVDVYGSDVLGYSCTRKKDNGSELDWQLFYIDEEDDHRVYLISKEYMVPPTTGTELTKSTDSSYPKAYYWNDTVLNKYKTTIPNTPFTTKFLSDYAGTSASGQENLQSTNYMLDQSIWQEYISTNDKSDYAFGGPTLPLFQASYNDICKAATRLDIQKSGTGYQVRLGMGSWNYYQSGYGDISTQKGIYFKGNRSNSAPAMNLASPSYLGASCVMYARYDGLLTALSYENVILGFRPIISLKSDVIFTGNGDGTYTIN